MWNGALSALPAHSNLEKINVGGGFDSNDFRLALAVAAPRSIAGSHERDHQTFAELIFPVGLKLQLVRGDLGGHRVFMPGNRLEPHANGQRDVTAVAVPAVR